MTVATAAPLIPSLGMPHNPKIRIGSRIILIIAPVACDIIVYSVLPVAWSSLSKINCEKIPNEKIMEKMDKIFTPMLNEYVNNSIESKSLSELRNTLLPKLMNGEIDLDNIEI